MAQYVYEGMFLFDSNRYARNPQGVSGKLGEMIKKRGGEMLASRLWSDQKLAYPINGQRKGTYWLTYFRLDGSKLVDIDRDCRLNEDLLRNLILKIDPRLVDTLVEHARQGTSSGKPAESEGKSADKTAEKSANKTAEKTTDKADKEVANTGNSKEKVSEAVSVGDSESKTE